jgi:hypothetical protein
MLYCCTCQLIAYGAWSTNDLAYFRSNWNRLDCFVVVLSLVSLAFPGVRCCRLLACYAGGVVTVALERCARACVRVTAQPFTVHAMLLVVVACISWRSLDRCGPFDPFVSSFDPRRFRCVLSAVCCVVAVVAAVILSCGF